MKKILPKFNLIITFIILLGISYVIKLIGVYSQGKAFIYLMGVLIFCTSFKIVLEVLTNYSENSKLFLILIMSGMYILILLTSWIAIKMLNVDLETAFLLISFGIAIPNVTKLKEKKESNSS
ncbi:MAG: hypothetical protein K0R72_1240 [Clostridia bacterium]|jgi:hypothetical protein|nr:hypothetical protein [Clostridia bacterium]